MPASNKPSHRNVAVVVGSVAREPEVRELPDGTTVVELDVRVASEGAPSTTVPVSWTGLTASPVAAGDEVVVVGRVRRRFYRAGGATASRTDVLAEVVVPATPAKRAVAALAAAADLVGT